MMSPLPRKNSVPGYTARTVPFAIIFKDWIGWPLWHMTEPFLNYLAIIFLLMVLFTLLKVLYTLFFSFIILILRIKYNSEYFLSMLLYISAFYVILY